MNVYISGSGAMYLANAPLAINDQLIPYPTPALLITLANQPPQSTTGAHDWTEGTGVFPAGGVITIPAPPPLIQRVWFYVQNQDLGTVSISYQAFTAAGAASTVDVLLATGGLAGIQGSSDERGKGSWCPQGSIIVTGTANQQVTVLEQLSGDYSVNMGNGNGN